ncbi:alpha/beta hydrolase [Bacteroides coprosuis]|uniref:alpha/beta hydrolase n=1 Tax=Bacteroides coprosuis TaxID=151276 RepID=UPI001DEA96C5|nr:alpha/beta fold hydrolase [Bacteroides coprosuis]HJD92212.1 prolyl oligopeptidase family serine peptidase [Bacteroides coprosuis]
MKFKFKIIFSVILVLFLKVDLLAAEVDTLTISSSFMEKEMKVILIRPTQYNERTPILYLLHGYSGNENSWLEIKSDLPQWSDKYDMTIVCPDAENSWYWDSPQLKKSQYESYFIKELIPYLSNRYNLSQDRSKTAITGLSMGGHGAFWYALRYPNKFGAVGSTSGGLDLRGFKTNWNLSNHLGDYTHNSIVWDTYTVATYIDQFQKSNQSIIFDCGVDDFFYQANLEIHQLMVEKKIKHDFISRPGAHNHAYWNNSIDYQLLFFYKFFNK